MQSATSGSQHLTSNGTLRGSIQQCQEKVEQCVKDDPRGAVLVSLGAGLGIGIALGLVLGGSRQMQSHGWFDRRTAEELGQKMMANVGSWIPDSISNRFSS